VSIEGIDFQRRSVQRFADRAILRADIMRRKLCMNVSVQLSEDGTEGVLHQKRRTVPYRIQGEESNESGSM